MHLVVPKWRISLAFKIPFIQIRSPIPTPTWWLWSSSCLTQQLVSFHSTPHCLEKKKRAFDTRYQRASKGYIRYTTRRKRAEAKKDLNKLLSDFNGVRYLYEKISKTERCDEDQADDSDIGRKKTKRNRKRKGLFDEDFEEEYDERKFRDFLKNKWHTWSFNESWEKFRSQDSTTGFEWRQNSNGTYSRNNKWANESDAESDNESYCVGSSSDRTLLGLPASGPLKIEDIKTAFRLSALKWHPDKHQCSGQVAAEEKFKECVTAYKSLCSLFSSA